MNNSEVVKVEISDLVALITLNRPEKLNAINGELATLLGNAFEVANTNSEVRVIVLTGSGRAFCAGADLTAVEAGAPLTADGHEAWGFGGITRQWTDKPSIAAVNGLAYGGGLELVLACDLVVADPEATFALPEVKRGLIASGGGLLRLPLKIPENIALEMALTGEPINAVQGAQWGLVNHISDSGECVNHAMKLARLIAGNAPLAVELSKSLIHRGIISNDPWEEENWESNSKVHDRILKTLDAREGVSAFIEKRKPIWKRS